MSVEVVVRKDLNLVYTSYTGHVLFSELNDAIFMTLEHPDYREGMTELTDLSGADSTDLDLDRLKTHMTSTSTYYGVQRNLTKHVIIAKSELQFTFAAAYQQLIKNKAENVELHVFRSEGAALKAMGCEVATVADLLQL